jgi:polyisoprenoid-binding protein YceI
MKLVKTGLVSVLLASTLFGGTYNVDASHSHVGFKVKHMMISNVKGNFDKFSGSFEYDEATKTVKSLTGTVVIDSINTQNEKRDGHLKSGDFFLAEKYPEMKLELTKIQGDTAYGKLTLRGVTKDIELEIENNGMIKDPWGNTRVGLALNGKINRMDYGVKYNSVLEAGGVAVGETVKFDVELEGVLAK